MMMRGHIQQQQQQNVSSCRGRQSSYYRGWSSTCSSLRGNGAWMKSVGHRQCHRVPRNPCRILNLFTGWLILFLFLFPLSNTSCRFFSRTKFQKHSKSILCNVHIFRK